MCTTNLCARMIRAVLQCEARLPAVYRDGYCIARKRYGAWYTPQDAAAALCVVVDDDSTDDLRTETSLRYAFDVLRDTTSRIILHCAACALLMHDMQWLHVMYKAFCNLCDLESVEAAVRMLTHAIVVYVSDDSDDIECRVADLECIVYKHVCIHLYCTARVIECVRACLCVQKYPARIVRVLHDLDPYVASRARVFSTSARAAFLKIVIM